MSVLRGTTIKAALVAGRLLESDLEFYNILQPSEDTIYFEGGPEGADGQGQMEIWWSAEIDSRSWGIKDITVNIKKLKLEGWFEQLIDGRTRDVGQSFSYSYPEPDEKLQIADVDEPSPDNVYRLAKPKWNLTWKISSGDHVVYARHAVVDVQKHTIEIEF
jgi:hypothetical protein